VLGLGPCDLCVDLFLHFLHDLPSASRLLLRLFIQGLSFVLDLFDANIEFEQLVADDVILGLGLVHLRLGLELIKVKTRVVLPGFDL